MALKNQFPGIYLLDFPNAFRKGGLCIALMSCNRSYYMIENLGLLLFYIQKYEPKLNYNLIWIDTATQGQAQLNEKLSSKFHFDRKVFLPTASHKRLLVGITTVYQIAVHLCKNNDFIMPLEEDWKLIQTPRIGFINKTIEILDNSPHSLMGIVFKNTEPRAKHEKNLLIKVQNEVFNITYGLDRTFQFTNGASIYRMSNILELLHEGLNPKISFESSLSVTARKFGMYFGFVDLIKNCKRKPGYCYGIFRHVGKISSWHGYA